MSCVNARTVKVLLGIQAILIGMIVGLVAGILAGSSGITFATAAAVAGGALMTSIPVVLAIQRAIVM